MECAVRYAEENRREICGKRCYRDESGVLMKLYQPDQSNYNLDIIFCLNLYKSSEILSCPCNETGKLIP